MSTANSLPDLKSWAQPRLAALYSASDASDEAHVSNTIQTTLSSNVKILANHAEVSLQQWQESVLPRRGNVEWKNVIDVPDGGEGVQTGIVSGHLVVTRNLKFRIRAAPAQIQTFVTLSAKIEEDGQATPDELGDRRRIVHLIETSVDKRPPIHLHGAGASD